MGRPRKDFNSDKPKKQRNFKCHICSDWSTTTSFELKWHINCAHTREISFPCSVCSKKFYRASHLQVHLKRHHSESSNKPTFPHKCNGAECYRSFPSQEKLENHMKKHKMECPFCAKRAISQSALNKHTISHTGENAVQCKQCKKWYPTKNGLKTHRCRRRLGGPSRAQSSEGKDVFST